MPSFLEEVSIELLKKHAGHLGDLTVVFPNRRAGLFFREILSRRVTEPGWSPRLLTFTDLVGELSPLHCPDKLTLIFILYRVYVAESGSKETFDQFYFWGELLIADFEEIDKNLVQADDLFANLRDLKALEAPFDYLTDEQRRLIAQFWRGFDSETGEPLSKPKQAFLTFWNALSRVYHTYRTHLQHLQLGYEGLMTRTVAESLDQYAGAYPAERLAFVGFNALYRAEERIVRWFVRQREADAWWDIDAHYLKDSVQEAGFFFRRYLKQPDLAPTFPASLPQHFYGGAARQAARQVDIVGVTLEVGQAKFVGNKLQELIRRGNFVPERTAIVLPDQNLLFPVLHALPADIRRVNVTMGYPLRNTSLYSLIEQLLRLQESKRTATDETGYEFHHQSLLSVLRHPYVAPIDRDVNRLLIRRIEDENRIYVSASELQQTPFLRSLFQPVDQVPDTFTYLLQLLSYLHDQVAPALPEADGLTEAVVDLPEADARLADEPDTPSDLVLPVLEKELIYHLYIHLNRLKALSEENQFEFEQDTFLKLLRQLMQSLRLPFTGEPLRGLQIMGTLETRNLDFDHVFILSANEGIYPPKEVDHSFIPGNLRRGFGLPTPDYQDAIYAYTFYRLLHRSQHLYLIHNTEDTAALSGEMSRFLSQLIYESERQDDGSYRYPDQKGSLHIRRHTLSAPVRTAPPQPITVQKSEAVRTQLAVYTEAGRSGLTPSALNTYLDCRLKFYFKYVAGLRESDGVQDNVDPAVFGNVLHKAMECVYQAHVERYGNQPITAEAIEQLKGEPLDKAVRQGFQEHFRGQTDERFRLEGRNLIAYDMVHKMARRILDMDAQDAPFEIVSLERASDTGYVRLLEVLTDVGRQRVRIKGIIDRVDRKDGGVRVLDYKTGRDEKRMKSVASLFDRNDERRNKAAMQALFYAFLFEPQTSPDERITPGLINAKDLFGDQFDPRLILNKHPLEDFRTCQSEFIDQLVQLLAELFGSDRPFDQTEDKKKCDYCPFARICY